MSLVPLLFSDWWEDSPYDLEGLDDRIAPRSTDLLVYKPNKLRNRFSRFHPIHHNDHGLLRRHHRRSSVVSADKDKFCVTLDVQQFHPEEINVKVVDNYIVVDAKHEEKEDQHGWISRQFTRKYFVPDECNIDQVESHLSSDGVLTVTAPKKELPNSGSNEKIIKIQYTGEPAITHAENAAIAGGSSQSTNESPQRQAAQAKKPTVKAA